MGHDHVIGIAGAGMSAIAHLLLDQGQTVSGCDQQRNALADDLIDRGVTFILGHDPVHLASVDRVITSSALHPSHPELVAARARRARAQARRSMAGVVAAKADAGDRGDARQNHDHRHVRDDPERTRS